eukprot:2423373-Rhodomonas_salina.1
MAAFSHGNMDLSEFVQIHKNFRDFRRKARKEEVQNNLEGDTSPFSRPLQRSKTGAIPFSPAAPPHQTRQVLSIFLESSRRE